MRSKSITAALTTFRVLPFCRENDYVDGCVDYRVVAVHSL